MDSLIVENALTELGYQLIAGETQIHHVPTNAIWFGASIPIKDVKLIAFTLIRAGIKIKKIRPFRNPTEERANLIQVGADEVLITHPPLSVEEIKRAKEFLRFE